MKRLMSLLLIVPVVVAAMLVVYLALPLKVSTPVVLYFPQATTPSKAVDLLVRKGTVRYPLVMQSLLVVGVRLGGGRLHRGTYRFESTSTHADVIRALLLGQGVLTVRLTIPEGTTLRRFASIVERQAMTDSGEVMAYATSDSLCSALGIPVSSVEGYVMPDTYEVYVKQPAREIVDRLLRQQRTVWQEQCERRARELAMTKHEVLTLASIVEKEATNDEERSLIASVYLNRLRRHMKLAADPTVQYALGGEARRVLFKDLEFDSPYNTYKYEGLPPGPICAPGLKSIIAVLNPADTPYIFFCARGDGSNRHSFASTASEHERNVAAYRRNRSMYGN